MTVTDDAMTHDVVLGRGDGSIRKFRVYGRPMPGNGDIITLPVATIAPASINARLIAWFQHLRAKEIGIVTRDFVCEMVQFFCNVA
jgi:hypothetical protein